MCYPNVHKCLRQVPLEHSLVWICMTGIANDKWNYWWSYMLEKQGFKQLVESSTQDTRFQLENIFEFTRLDYFSYSKTYVLISYLIVLLNFVTGKSPWASIALTFDLCCIMVCHYYCTIMPLALCFNRFALWITNCVINDSNSLEKRDGKCSSFAYTYKCCCLRASIKRWPAFFPCIIKIIVILLLFLGSWPISPSSLVSTD